MPSDEQPIVSIPLWRADAIVLLDWVSNVDLNAVPIRHPADKQALMDLYTRFEMGTELGDPSQEDIDRAREEVSRDMGW